MRSRQDIANEIVRISSNISIIAVILTKDVAEDEDMIKGRIKSWTEEMYKLCKELKDA